jgi:beta-glucanase (GH16 family)
MQVRGQTRIVIGTAMAMAAAGYFMFSAQAPNSAARAQESARAAKNTGGPAGPGFLLDFTKRQDSSAHYLADYEMDEEWIRIAYRSSNIDFGKDGMKLSLAKLPRGKLPFSGAEFQRNGTYGYGRYEAVLTAAEGYGAISSFFTYTGSHFGDAHDEIDFEFVAKSPRQVHLNHFQNGDEHPIDIPLWFNTAQAPHLYAFEWSPNAIRWYVDGVKIHEATSEIPTTSGRVMANLWAGTGSATSWTGDPRFTYTSASYRCISHVPMGKSGAQCSDTFKAPPRPLASN